ncbi:MULTISPECIES: threonine/serine dehydratase [Yersinia]|uniref:Pyridoxal-phosphate dependent enzyme family protein n=1 Tax=Yersinia rochesterensis TaxID=1604335 RepID=A0A386HJV8_9GAMM|nr:MULTISPECIES: threonine/serine dehydratase [Yersinia]AJI87947.1 pyridoxal-phosphate dependent enzyme family protein [Yersinia frederiksenii Y225]CNH63835.1 pyridoxal-phosphate dependent protein [Yersinia kristensenii]AIN18510.1 pyridoxal-phosphate dependent enzyme family protein [Yersinia rochesterensis]AJJ37604.1 pyridoxal-phosphate dependent enzyme family protein [Yersinia rochesterensis]AYD45811.1 threonine/serine dehydratase [Yersinia rochesterensis]
MNTLFDAIKEAHQVLRPQVRVTPLEYSPLLSQHSGCEIYLKCEHLQHTGSFKFRGASNKLRLLTDEQRQQGVITASTGNHGQAMALAGKLAGVKATIYAPEQAAAIKLEAIRALGGEVELIPGDALNAELAADSAAQQQGKIYISPYNDEQIIAGQGTCGMEMVEQQPNLDAVFVAVGGGGLISGIATVLKKLSDKTQIIGCWPANATSMYTSLENGQIQEVAEQETLSDGTAGGVEPGAITFALCQQLIDQKVLVSEQEIKDAMRLIARTDRWMIEGAAGVALAAALKLAPHWQGKKVAVVLCGKNIVLEKYLGAVSE